MPALGATLAYLQAPAAPQPPPRHRLVENFAQFGSGSMSEPPLPPPSNPYPHLTAFHPSGAVSGPTSTSSYSLEGMNQFSLYPNSPVDSANPQPPAVSIVDILPQTSYHWTAEDLELLSNLPPLELPSPCSNAAPGAASNVDLTRSSFPQHAPFSNGRHYVDVPNPTPLTLDPPTHAVLFDRWEILQKHIAPNALYNSSARFDAPKCDEDTRVEVTRELMEWIEDRGGPQRLLCMTGTAGSGKSALQQSIAERCAEDGILGAAYFISAADPSRNTAATIIPTIAYQLGLKHPVLQCSIAGAVRHDPFIFSQSLKTQMDVLVVRPFVSLGGSEEYDISTFPYAILIDGLDECQGDPSTTTNLGRVKAKYNAEDRQAELLSAIKNSLLNHDLPFRVFVASRPELPINTALGAGGTLCELAYHIQLSNQYDATDDMRRYLRRRFQDIGLRIGQPDWFTEGNIESLVRAGSGQFVYVATVFKYVSERRASPVHMLKTVLNWTPGQATRPFEALDILYTNILSNAKEAYEAVDAHSGRDFLLLLNMVRFDLGVFRDLLNALLNLEHNALEILTLDLRSLLYLREDKSGTMDVASYHKSLFDFMAEENRAKDLYVPASRVYAHVTKCYMQHIIESTDLHSLPDKREDMSVSERCLITAIAELESLNRRAAIDDEIVDFTHKGGWHKIDMVLSKPSGFDIIFSNDWDEPFEWISNLGHAAGDLKQRRPEAAAIMSEYLEKWETFFDEMCPEGEDDSNAD
ncbi:hypothetical protein EST38_g10259 [Candolleomyces aberdarensis]|uniref:Nephrocystin 3-like N-terminal domain-containing protein n=1 Tax=Candolleomyces aberdarensis TaxID=2316362 RepID=A0A4Q2D9J2_9AGAR|nr:hypothetical protein EST38_g10259 [Candolleomyces aberdarensis]